MLLYYKLLYKGINYIDKEQITLHISINKYNNRTFL